MLWSIEETELLQRHLARHCRELGDSDTAEILLDWVSEGEKRTAQAREMALRNCRMSETPLS